MKIETKTLEDHQVELTVEVDPELFEEAKQRAARRLAKRVKIPGFRPGKAPYPVIVRHLGEPAIIEEAIELLANDIYPQVIKEAQIEPYTMGSLEDIPSLDPPTFKFLVPLKAQVELGDYRSIRLPYELKPVTDEEIDEVLNNLRERQALIGPVDRPAQEGDLVRIRLSAEKQNPAEGVDPIVIKDHSHTVIILAEDADDSDEYPFPGFSRHLIGMSAGEQKTVIHTYPDDAAEQLRGAMVAFNITLNQVNQRTLPELDDEFAKSVGDYENLDELRAAIRKDLEQYTQDEYNEEYTEKILEEVVKTSTIKYPPQMLEQEIETVIHRLENRLADQNLDLDLYLKSRQMDLDGLREEAKPVAVSRLESTLTLLELAHKEEINVEKDELQSETSRTLNLLSNYMEEKNFRQMLRSEDSRASLVSNLMMDMIIEKTQARLRDIARGLVENTPAETELLSTPTEATSAESEAEPLPEEPVGTTEHPSPPILPETLSEDKPEETRA